MNMVQSNFDQTQVEVVSRNVVPHRKSTKSMKSAARSSLLFLGQNSPDGRKSQTTQIENVCERKPKYRPTTITTDTSTGTGYFPSPVATISISDDASVLSTEIIDEPKLASVNSHLFGSPESLEFTDSSEELISPVLMDGKDSKFFFDSQEKKKPSRPKFPHFISKLDTSDPKSLEALKRKNEEEFGTIESPFHKCVSKYPEGYDMVPPIADEPPYYVIIETYLSFLILICFGHIRDFLGKRFKPKDYSSLKAQDGYAPLFSDFDSFYIRRLKLRINDCFHRPITGVPGRMINLIDRTSHNFNISYEYPGTITKCLNLSSYNYLGFAQSGGVVTSAVQETIRRYGVSSCAPRSLGGTLDLHEDVEALTAYFVGKEAASVYSQGFGTNSTVFSSLVGKGCLLISDELNHASIRFGMRLSHSHLRVFKHNDMEDLEKLLRECISQGQPRTHRPWRKILVVVEGLYSMEGDLCDLPSLVRLRDKYKFYLFVDEAHSIGALGPNSRGVCDYFGVDPSRVDILMGTFTKSFGAAGGYIAGDEKLITKLKLNNAGSLYAESMSPIVLEQIRTALLAISGRVGEHEGRERVQRLTFNSRYLRLGLKRLGFIVFGQDDSPVIPLLIFHPGKLNAFSHEMLRRKIAVVIVSYPATNLLTSRVRFCVSASHTKSDLDRVLRACDEIGDLMNLKSSSGAAGDCIGPKYLNWVFNGGKRISDSKASRKPIRPPRWPLPKVVACGEADVHY